MNTSNLCDCSINPTRFSLGTTGHDGWGWTWRVGLDMTGANISTYSARIHNPECARGEYTNNSQLSFQVYLQVNLPIIQSKRIYQFFRETENIYTHIYTIAHTLLMRRCCLDMLYYFITILQDFSSKVYA